jgi:hypothetical protein
VAVVFGLIYTILGTVGFAVSGFDGFAAPRGDTLTIFEVNPLQNLVHLALGWWMVNAGFRGEGPGLRAGWVAAVVLGLLGLAGVTWFRAEPGLNFINSNAAVDIAHLVSAGTIAGWLGLGAARREPVP